MSRKFNEGTEFTVRNSKSTYRVSHRFGNKIVVTALDEHGDTHFEVMVVRTHKHDHTLENRVVHLAGDEFLPSPNEWGTYGWTPTSLNRALQIAQE